MALFTSSPVSPPVISFTAMPLCLVKASITSLDGVKES